MGCLNTSTCMLRHTRTLWVQYGSSEPVVRRVLPGARGEAMNVLHSHFERRLPMHSLILTTPWGCASPLRRVSIQPS